MVHGRDLLIQRPVIVDHADEQQAEAQQIEDTRADLAHIKTVQAEYPEERQQHPANSEVHFTFHIPAIGRTFEHRHEKQVNDPPDTKQTQGEQIDGAAYRAAEIEAMRAQETEDPQHVSDEQTMCIIGIHIKRVA